jgi:hypothetical protein
MDLLKLKPLIPKLSIDYKQEDLKQLANHFQYDFIDNPFSISGLKIKVITKPVRHGEFRGYPETFVHLITRKNLEKKRVFDPFRANKIHWIKPILLNHRENEIKKFQYKEGSGKMRDYYWFDKGDFIVIMQKIMPDYLVVTSFNIDNKRTRKHYESRYFEYLSHK